VASEAEAVVDTEWNVVDDTARPRDEFAVAGMQTKSALHRTWKGQRRARYHDHRGIRGID
jgi:hypothetical protein